jgi:malonyl CoA-acyl carrier protein transacylase
MVFPSSAAILQNKLGIAGCPAFDVQAVCSGFVYALTVADAMIRTGTARCALVVGAEVFSRILDFNDRTTCVLFGDGAGAVVLEASEEPGILASDLHADGKHVGILCVPGHVSGGNVLGTPLLHMDGQAVFKLAVRVLEEAARATLAKAGKTEADIDWLIPHQANIRIMEGTAKKLKLPRDKLIVTVNEHGNTSAASIPLALDEAVRDPARSRRATPSCSKAWAAASPGARCCLNSVACCRASKGLQCDMTLKTMKSFRFCLSRSGLAGRRHARRLGRPSGRGRNAARSLDALGEDIAGLIKNGPKEELALTTNTQPVMLVAGVAAWRAWLAEGGAAPSVVAGHSLGEYSALVASGVLTLAQAAPLVRFRAQAMQQAVPVGVGAMAAVLGMEAAKVVAGCAEATASFGTDSAEIVEAVNFNDPMQTVIAGSKAAVDKACELLKANGAKRALLLPVSAPFHSSLMKPAAEALRERLARSRSPRRGFRW